MNRPVVLIFIIALIALLPMCCIFSGMLAGSNFMAWRVMEAIDPNLGSDAQKIKSEISEFLDMHSKETYDDENEDGCIRTWEQLFSLELCEYTVRQLPSDGVCTKYNKAAVTTLLINSKLMRIIREWDDMVRSQCPPDSTWYARLDNTGRLVPKTVVPMTVENKDELKKKALYPYSGFCKDLRKICKMAGVTYKSPHKARYGHIHLGFSKAKTAEERKAVSINAMHESLSITDDVYARMSSYQANKILLSFNFDEDDSAGSGQP